MYCFSIFVVRVGAEESFPVKPPMEHEARIFGIRIPGAAARLERAQGGRSNSESWTLTVANVYRLQLAATNPRKYFYRVTRAGAALSVVSDDFGENPWKGR